MESQLGAWLKKQYGTGGRYKTARQLSLAISDGRNPNQVFDIEARGTAKPETLSRIAVALDMAVLDVFIASGWIPIEEIEAKVGLVLTTLQERAVVVCEELPGEFAEDWLESGERLHRRLQGIEE